MGIEQAVIFTGIRRDIPDFLNAFDVFFLPSRYEGLPVVGMEAQAAGLPCLMSDAITKDTAVTPLVEFFPLTAAVGDWADKLLSYENREKRTYSDLLRNSGFEIKQEAEKLCRWYEDLQKGAAN